ncbi:hypothetical protein KKB10_00730 [Patescibacteria group bacterium]|nr:hypothetical protein [Patescibacteria group bacterium]MBU1075476.1 hypothetical protein [Patescibacteria group bacterium]MBU1951581.1 hypothetical protein [Patescibacteria group bacterium]MBU2229254.1 hypothetical protein [Patescibacteria group bacterium]
MKKISLIAIMLLTVAIVSGAGCTKNATENAVESATGGSADVDIDNNTMKVETDEGTLEVGENVSLPSDFPSDVHVADGDILLASKTSDDAFSVTVETSKSVSEMQTEYETEFANDGWDVNTTLAFGGMVTLGGEKDNRMVTVSISESEGKTLVIITTAQTE